jgi:hypothetical protein
MSEITFLIFQFLAVEQCTVKSRWLHYQLKAKDRASTEKTNREKREHFWPKEFVIEI